MRDTLRMCSGFTGPLADAVQPWRGIDTIPADRPDGCRYVCTLVFPIRVALQLRYSLLRGEDRSHKKMLEIVPPKFRYIIDKMLYIIFLGLLMSIDPLPPRCADLDAGLNFLPNATLNTTLSESGMIRRRIAAKGRGQTVAGNTAASMVRRCRRCALPSACAELTPNAVAADLSGRGGRDVRDRV